MTKVVFKRIRRDGSRWAIFCFTVTAACVISLGQAPAGSQIRLGAGEKYGIIPVSIRAGYLWPTAVTVEPGVYRIQIDDPSRLAPGTEAAIDDDAGRRQQSKPIEAKGHRTSFQIRLAAGKHRIKVGINPNWVLQVTVETPK